MSDQTKTREELIAELNVLRQEVAALKSIECKSEAVRCHIEEQLHTLITSVPDAICFKDGEGRWLAANESIIQLLGLENTQYIGKKDSELAELLPLLSESLQACQDTDLIAWQAGHPIACEEIFPQLDGTNVTLEVIKAPILDSDGKRKGLVIIGRDVTERNRTQKALLQSIQQFKTLAENAPYIISRVNRDLQYSYINPAITIFTGIPHENFIGKTAAEVGVNETLNQTVEKYLLETFSTGEECSFESSFRGSNGELNFYRCHMVPEFSDDGIVQSVLRISNDITTQKYLEKEIARLDRLNLVGEMAAGMGHEVRNPLTTVRGFLQILERKNQYDHQTEYFTLMLEELDRANSIITEFLSLAKDKAINKRLQDLNTTILAIAPLIQADGLVTNKYVKLELQEHLPCLLLDEKEIRQLILNLVRNGLEAMPTTGTLTIKTFMDETEVILAVQDEGIGIAPDILEKLGTPFFTTKDQGTGLGLAVCYNIAHRHNAIIEPRNHSTGTTFLVRFAK